MNTGRYATWHRSGHLVYILLCLGLGAFCLGACGPNMGTTVSRPTSTIQAIASDSAVRASPTSRPTEVVMATVTTSPTIVSTLVPLPSLTPTASPTITRLVSPTQTSIPTKPPNVSALGLTPNAGSVVSSIQPTPVWIGMELFNDDGEPDGCLSLGGDGRGFAVRFDTNKERLAINHVKVYGFIRGAGQAQQRRVIQILDEHQNVLAQTDFAYSIFPDLANKGWVTIAIPETTVQGEFYVLVATGSDQSGGLPICYDEDLPNRGSSEARSWVPGQWKVNLPQANTNWMIRVLTTRAEIDLPLSKPAYTAGMTYEQTISVLLNSDELSTWMIRNLRFESFYDDWMQGARRRRTPEETFAAHGGYCGELVIFAASVLEQHGYDIQIMSIQVATEPAKGHSVLVFMEGEQLYTINNGRKLGPYPSLDAIAFDHHSGWSQYRVYESWQNYQQLGKPDRTVDRKQ